MGIQRIYRDDSESCKWYSERSQLHIRSLLHRRKAKDVERQIKYSSQNRIEENEEVIPVLITSFTMGQALSASSHYSFCGKYGHIRVFVPKCVTNSYIPDLAKNT